MANSLLPLIEWWTQDCGATEFSFASCKGKIDESDPLECLFIPDTYAVLVGAFFAVVFRALGADFDLAVFFFVLSGDLSSSLSDTTILRFAGAFSLSASGSTTRHLFLCTCRQEPSSLSHNSYGPDYISASPSGPRGQLAVKKQDSFLIAGSSLYEAQLAESPKSGGNLKEHGVKFAEICMTIQDWLFRRCKLALHNLRPSKSREFPKWVISFCKIPQQP